MAGIADLFRHLSGLANLAHAGEIDAAMGKGADAVVHNAQNRLGAYQEGWPSLADATVLERDRLGFPADEPLLRMGALRDSITATEERTAAGVTYVVGVPLDSPAGAYARPQELGTEGISAHPIPPRPFIVPAIEEEQAGVLRRADAAVRSALD